MEAITTKIRMLKIIFDVPLKPYEITAFRGAVANKVGPTSILFHNHTQDGFRHDYPLIQYKLINQNASILCVEEGVDEIYNLFQNSNHTISIGAQQYELKINKLLLNTFTINVWEHFFDYKIINWLALNDQNYQQYQSLISLADKIAMLEKILTANILSFFKGIGNYLSEDKKIEVKITEILTEKRIKYKNVHRLAFDICFKTNVFLPQHIGLGKAPSTGFGVVYKNEKKQKQDN